MVSIPVENNMELQRPRHISFNTENKKEYAVYVRNAYKSYGTKLDSLLILDGLEMSVPKGVIYGLLGASGCGKTTLLNCILGRKVLNSGDIWVLGGKPGSKGSGVPGPRVGYMPQSVGLYGEFTIRETLIFFGWVVGMSMEKINERLNFLLKLLMLPGEGRVVKTLSGGQQRRVSLAAALLHEPELLVLDEPTVGLDPVLRQNIWDHLVHLTSKGGTTVIITTHYIDETRQANLVAFMRSGYLLTETSPNYILREFNSETLEGVFLKLSEMQNVGRLYFENKKDKHNSMAPGGVDNGAARFEDIEDEDARSELSGKFGDSIPIERRLSITSATGGFPGRRASVKSLGRRVSITSLSKREGVRSSIKSLNASRRRLSVSSVQEDGAPLPEFPQENRTETILHEYSFFLNPNHMKALIWKNFLWMIRNVPIMLFIIALPFVHTCLFCLCVGNNPINLEVAIVNYESNNTEDCFGEMKCDSPQLGCFYLKKYLMVHDLKLIYYDSDVEARESVNKGDTYASMVIKKNFTDSLRTRIENPQEAREWDFEYSDIDVVRDLSDSFISQFLKVYLYDSFQNFIYGHLQSCNYSMNAVKLPLKIMKPVYGEAIPKFLDFAAPGITVTAIFFMAIALTALAMLIERSEGSFERSLIMGISGLELISAYVLCQFVVVIIQSTIMLLCLFVLFNLTLEGSIVTVVFLTLLCGFCGMCFGLLISCLCDNEKTAFFISMGSTMPMLALGGVIWPIEGMHYLIRPLVYTSPLTYSVESFRSILQRGWNTDHEVVVLGFVTTSVWSIAFLIISILIIKFKKG